MPQRKLREIVGDRVFLHVPPETTVRDACERMRDGHVTSVLVLDGGTLKGIFTKRDLVHRVVAADRDPAQTMIVEVMTPDPTCMHADCLGFEAVRAMREENTRHMVVHGLDRTDGSGYGVISRRNIPGSEMAAFENKLAFEKKVWEEI